MLRTGLDRLLADRTALAGRRYGLLTHLAAVSADLVPSHLALGRSATPPARLLGPEHGLYALYQDMVGAADGVDPWTGLPVVSLYGADASSLRPQAACLEGLDLLVIDLQDVGARYYTYAATAVWAAEAAIGAGLEVWVLDRPNPLGGVRVEGNLRRQGLESFIGAFAHPVIHGLTLGELMGLELAQRVASNGLRVWAMEGWRRQQTWDRTGRPWLAPSPNLPRLDTAVIYPGLCLVEATTLSEGRGTTRPFHLVGAPRIDPVSLARSLEARRLPGVRFVPARFRPEFQKHAGVSCGGVEIVVVDAARVEPYRLGVEMLLELARHPGFGWRTQPYEFVSDRPAIDLLSGDTALREAIESGVEPVEWLASWAADEEAFRRRREPRLLYPLDDEPADGGPVDGSLADGGARVGGEEGAK
jgi:uncharacterized protein YbbC (DUF1343 family)